MVTSLRRWATLVVVKLDVEWRARDTRLVVFGLTGLAVIKAWEAARRHNDVVSQVCSLLLALLPVAASALAAASLARDREAGALRAIPGDGGRSGWWAHASATLVLTTLAAAVAFAVATLPAYLAAADSGLGSLSRYLPALALALSLWTAVGAAIGSVAGSRAGALAGVLAVGVCDSAVSHMATSLPTFRWAYALSPLGISEIALNGRSSITVPMSVTTAPVVVATLGWLAVPLAMAGRQVGRLDRPRRWRLSARAVAAMVALSVPVGAAGGPLLAAILPWRMSPPWLVDVLNHNTPDAAVRRLFADAAARKPDALRILGPVALEAPPARALVATTDLTARRAGTVRVTWTGPRGGTGLYACATRTANAWRIVEVRQQGTCPE